MKSIFATIGLLVVLFAGCKINPAVLQTNAKADDTKSNTVKASGFEQIKDKDNMLTNSGFEDGTEGWTPFGSSQIDTTSDHVHSGDNALAITGRLESWQGAGINLINLVTAGTTYRVSAWVSLDADQSSTIRLTLKRVDGAGTKYTTVSSSKVMGPEWVQLAGEFKAEVTGELKELTLYFEGPGAGIDIYVDDVALAKK